MNKGLLSICCVSYNHGNYIERCIKSIWNQDYKNIEILVLDDGSKDNSVEILNSLKEQSPCPMSVISQENTGKIGENFNKVINLSQGEYISIIACDDEFIPNTFLEKLDILEKNPEIEFVCSSQILSINENNCISDTAPPMLLDNIENPSADDLLNLDFNDFHSYYIQGAVYRLSLIKEIKAFDDDMICDDIILRTKSAQFIKKHKNAKFRVLKKPLVYYRNHPGNVSKNSLRQLNGIIEYLGRYWSNEKPPEKLLKWIKYSAGEEKDFSKIYDIFQKDDPYIKKLVQKYGFKNKITKSGFLYKNIGIPYIFEIQCLIGNGKKTKNIKLFGHTIHEKTKTLKKI